MRNVLLAVNGILIATVCGVLMWRQPSPSADEPERLQLTVQPHALQLPVKSLSLSDPALRLASVEIGSETSANDAPAIIESIDSYKYVWPLGKPEVVFLRSRTFEAKEIALEGWSGILTNDAGSNKYTIAQSTSIIYLGKKSTSYKPFTKPEIGDYELVCTIYSPASGAPLTPSLVAFQSGKNYPWLPLPSNNGTNLLKGHYATIGVKAKAYGGNEDVRWVLCKTEDKTTTILNSGRTSRANDGTNMVSISSADLHQGQSRLEIVEVGNDGSVFSKDSLDFSFADPSSTPISLTGPASPIRLSSSGESKIVWSVAVAPDKAAAYAITLTRSGEEVAPPQSLSSTVTFVPKKLPQGLSDLSATVYAGDKEVARSVVTVDVQTGGFKVVNVNDQGVGAVVGRSQISLELSRPMVTDVSADKLLLWQDRKDGASYVPAKFTHKFEKNLDAQKIYINVTEPVAADYELRLDASGLTDAYGNLLEGSDGVPGHVFVAKFGISKQATPSSDPLLAPGIERSKAEYVTYPEFVTRPPLVEGFNPSDKVETRVSRLYFYRDAHRVAQILNRRAQSHNRHGAGTLRQMAEKSRQEAESRTTARQMSERNAIEASKRSRELENQLSDLQRAMNQSLQQLQAEASKSNPDRNVMAQLEVTARSFSKQAEAVEGQLTAARDTEVKANEKSLESQRSEELARADQFRLETAAAHADPDTFAAGTPNSVDPIEQVSISVIGEGVLHLRGPLKGVNQMRIMIDQIDSPQGQVRLNIHSTQINGDEADHLEAVSNRIQIYIDQARFLTAQSGEMLRKAVVHVGSRRAEEARAACLGQSQADRDQAYLYAFFGRDFIDELRSMDSEFLHTGNKLLSLHSMDVTSLSNALLLISLANNSTRLEILQEFERLVQSELPMAEQQYIQNGIGCCKGGCKLGCKHDKHHAPPICMMAGNSSFTSLKGFFDAQVASNETMSPLQREFIRLGQIFKARLVTEMEYKQRVVERSIIEERLSQGDSAMSRKTQELDALNAVKEAKKALINARQVVMPKVAEVLSDFQEEFVIEKPGQDANEITINTTLSKADEFKLQKQFKSALGREYDSTKRVDQDLFNQLPKNNRATLESLHSSASSFKRIFLEFDDHNRESQLMLRSAIEALEAWMVYKGTLESLGREYSVKFDIQPASQALREWFAAVSKYHAASSIARDARRPLDHKKFLEMLIDDLEEKYIELLEGTRAHTANVDNYLKRLTTALDDDFNTQYYFPSFRLVRQASQFRKVEFGQTETTNVLCNNRQLGKVSPSATMEFDLPKRDILIEEGIDSALAIYNDVGALVNDPNLLALAKMQSGSSPATAAAGTLGGYGGVRNVLPGLQTDTAERLMAQNAGSGPKFESNVEKLIPDPAIYKFETGTGYEVRPVIAPDGQAVVFDFNYMYTTQVREPVRADEKHLGRVKQHYIDTDVQLSNFELREVSRYVVALKAERTAKGVPLLEDIPVVGALWRPLASKEKSLQQNIIMAQATIFPTLFDLMGLRWAPAVSDLDPMRLSNREYIVRGRHHFLENRIYDYSSSRVDEFLRIPEDVRRADLYRSQETLPTMHPNGYQGPGLDFQRSQGVDGSHFGSEPPPLQFVPGQSAEGPNFLPYQNTAPPKPNIESFPLPQPRAFPHTEEELPMPTSTRSGSSQVPRMKNQPMPSTATRRVRSMR